MELNTVLENLPWTYREDPWMLAITSALEQALCRQTAEGWEIAGQILLDTLTWNIKTEERIAGITPPPGATLEERRAALSAKWRTGGGKATAQQVADVAEAWMGCETKVVFQDGHVLISFVDCETGPDDLEPMRKSVREIVPAHLPIDYIFFFALSRTLYIRQRIQASTLRYYYHLGSWALGEHPFAEMEGQVTITDINNQIQEALLNAVAAFTAEEVARVRINGETLLDRFDVKEASGAFVTVRFTLSQQEFPHLTMLELLDQDGQPLTAASLDLTLRGYTQFEFVLPIKEGP